MNQAIASWDALKLRKSVIALLAAFIAFYAIYSAWVGITDITFNRTLVMTVAMTAVLLQYPLSEHLGSRPLTGAWRHAANVIDLLLIAAFAYAVRAAVVILALLDETLYVFQPWDLAVACVAVVIIIEATRRAFGMPIVWVSVVAIAMLFAGPILPGFLHHTGISLDRSAEMVWYSLLGVFGTPLGIVIQVVVIYIVFGTVLEKSGASDALIRIALALSGGTRGGPAHAAVMGSAMFGSMSGSVTANVVGTGSFTIPMIKRKGFPAPIAGAIEAAASTGGQITPPVMGAAAFLMAELLNTNYSNILMAALVPAVFYYLALFIAISIEARRANIQITPKHERVRLNRHDLLSSLGFLIPIAVIAAVLIVGYSASMAGFLATLCAAALGLFRPTVRRNVWRVYGEALVQSGIAAATILAVVACIGVVIAIMNLTGIGIAFASLVASYANESLFLALLITALACLILGMGMATLPAYLIIVLVMGPALQKLGVEPMAAHMFVLYFGVLSAITPPVAIGAFAAAPIAGSSPMITAVHASRLAIGAFIIPFVFTYQPMLLLQGEFVLSTFAFTALSMGVGIWLLNTALAGFSGHALGWGQRGLHLAGALALFVQVPAIQGVALVAALIKIWMDHRERPIT